MAERVWDGNGPPPECTGCGLRDGEPQDERGRCRHCQTLKRVVKRHVEQLEKAAGGELT